jgi:hypothetical protein
MRVRQHVAVFVYFGFSQKRLYREYTSNNRGIDTRERQSTTVIPILSSSYLKNNRSTHMETYSFGFGRAERAHV